MAFVYDFEVFEKDWLVVIQDLTTGFSFEIANDREALLQFYEEHREELFIGYNNKRYDDYIFKVILLGENPKHVSDIIIEQGNIMKLWNMFDLNKYPLFSLDISLNGGWASLKELEGFIGLDIEESSVPFDIKRRLTQSELEETFFYCRYDVTATKEIVKKSMGEIKANLDLIKEFGMSKTDLKKTNGQLTAKILGADKVLSYDDELDPYIAPPELKINKYTDVLEFYTKPEGGKLNYKKHYNRDIAGVPHVLAYGGIHGAIRNFHYTGELILLDVSSYYPSMMIEFDYMSRGVPEDKKKLFTNMYNNRLEMKAKGLKGAGHHKLILNTTYGNMKNIYNGLYDPRNANNVCITGQLLLIDLIEKIEPYCKVIQSNTDGVLVIPYDKKRVLEETEKWSERTRMPIDPEYFTGVYQKDVNNYIMVEENGYVKLKGGMVSQSDINGGHKGTARQSRAIVDDAVVNYFVKGIEPEVTVNNCNDPLRFQIISKTGNTFYTTVWSYDDEMTEVQKVNRIFAVTDEKAGRLRKVKDVNGDDRFTNPANTPEHAMLVNKSIDEFDMSTLDRQWYIDMAKDRIRQYEG